MKFNVTCDGEAATVEITEDGKGGFTGTLVASKIGSCPIVGTVLGGGSYSGTVTVEGYHPTFTAAVSGDAVSGEIKEGWLEDEKFTGTLVS